MKKKIHVVMILFIVLCATSVFGAQESRVTREQSIRLTGFWSYKFTTLNGQFGVLDGGGTRLMINRSIIIGLGGYKSIEGPRVDEWYLQMGYGGIWTEYVFNSFSLLHFSVGGLVGAGGVGYTNKSIDETYISGMFILEPEAYITVNVTEFLRFSVGGSYRLGLGVTDVPGIDNNDVSGFSGTVLLRLGGF